jgi:hypothetical protein
MDHLYVEMQMLVILMTVPCLTIDIGARVSTVGVKNLYLLMELIEKINNCILQQTH